MYETPITIVGNVVGEPAVRTTQSGRPVTNFRVASTARRFNRVKEAYEDSDTLWMSVVCWADIARNAASSLHKGDPVIVFGRLSSREFVKDEQRRVNFEITADALGHNLARGTSAFARVNRSIGVTSVPVGEDGMPEDVTEELLEQQLRDADLRDGAFAAHVAGPPDAGPDPMRSRGPADHDEVEPLPNSGPLVPIG